MRLGQLARQLSISPDKIVTFLGSRDIVIDSGNNARIDDAYVGMILQEFAPGDETIRQQVAQAPDTNELTEAPPAESVVLDQDEAQAPPEVIKAPKIELPGLRVVGKIELPEKKKPEPKKEEEKESRNAPAPRINRRPAQRRDEKNPVALAREREERERKRKLEEQREKEKQRRAEHYQKRLKPQAPTRPVRMVREEVEEMPPLEPEKPKTLWGRFMRWLNT